MKGRVAVAIALGLALTGCASVSLDSYRDLPTDEQGKPLIAVPGGLDLSGPQAVWLSEDRFAVTHFGGSSSCQPYPTSVTVIGDQEIEIAMFQPWCPVATADMSSTTYELEAPEDISPRIDAVVHIEGTEVLLPALP